MKARAILISVGLMAFALFGFRLIRPTAASVQSQANSLKGEIPISTKGRTIAESVPNGSELLADCRVALQTSEKTKEGAVCTAFIQGLNFGYQSAQATRVAHTLCVNGDTAMTLVIQRVVSYLGSQSQRSLQDTPGSLLVMEALEKAYPCS